MAGDVDVDVATVVDVVPDAVVVVGADATEVEDVEVIDGRVVETARRIVVGGTGVVVVEVELSASTSTEVLDAGAVDSVAVDGVATGTSVVGGTVVVVDVVDEVVDEVVDDVVDEDVDEDDVGAGEMSVDRTVMLKFKPAQLPDVTFPHVEPLSELIWRTKDTLEPAGVGAAELHFQLTVPVLWNTTKYCVADVPRSMSATALKVKSPSPHGSTDCPLMSVDTCWSGDPLAADHRLRVKLPAVAELFVEFALRTLMRTDFR